MSKTKEVKVEKKVPMPVSGRVRGRDIKYPFDTMKVGDSFFVEADTDRRTSMRASAMALAIYHCKGTQKQFKSHFCDNGFRIWRRK